MLALIGISNTIYSAAEIVGGGVTASDVETNTQNAYGTKCPDSNRTCGYWKYYSFPTNVSDFMANYNWPSGYGSQASLHKTEGGYVRDIDTSTKQDSEAYAETSKDVDHWYYAYYS